MRSSGGSVCVGVDRVVLAVDAVAVSAVEEWEVESRVVPQLARIATVVTSSHVRSGGRLLTIRATAPVSRSEVSKG